MMAPHNNVEHHIKEFQQRIDEIEHRISHQHLSEGQIYILRSTQADCQGRIDILDVVQSNRVDTIESIEAALERLEEVVQGIRYKDAERNARTHVGPPLIYYGSLPDEQEKGVRSASDDYPRHIPPEDHDLPMDQWGVYQEEVAVGQYDASEDDLSQEEVME